MNATRPVRSEADGDQTIWKDLKVPSPKGTLRDTKMRVNVTGVVHRSPTRRKDLYHISPPLAAQTLADAVGVYVAVTLTVGV